MTDDEGALVGTKLGPYRIEKLLGAGAMGDVFLGVHEALGRQVAIKALKPHVAADRLLTERFFAEARAVNIIRHENIVECTDLVNDPSGKSYIVMELLEGSTLSVAIRRAKRIPPRRAARIGAQIADALGAAHAKGIVHRDLKPDNVFLIKRAGTSDYVKVLDFGMARLRPEAGGVGATQSGALIGTPAYMSPEQARGEKVGPSTDIYALGVLLYQMLTGELPFAATSLTMMLVAHLQETPPRVDKLATDVPIPLADLIARTLAKQTSERPADMATLRVELLEAAGLPLDPPSLIDSSPQLAASVALGDTMSSEQSPLASATAPPPTVPAIGQSSVSGAASELLPAPAATRRRWPLFAAGGAVAIGAAITIVVATRGPGSTAEPAAPQPATAVTPPAPAPAAAPVQAVAPPEHVDPQPVHEATDAGVDARPPDKVVTHKPVDHPKTVKKPPIAVKTEPKPDAGSAAPIEPPKTDRTKTLVGPKPPP